jgi:hypothetical protein
VGEEGGKGGREGGREGGRARRQSFGERMSISELELDADVRDVINRSLVERDRWVGREGRRAGGREGGREGGRSGGRRDVFNGL